MTFSTVIRAVYTPIKCADKSLWRVVMMRHADHWEIFVHDTLIRYMTDEELPEEVRMKLSMITAYKSDHLMQSIPLSSMEIYKNNFPTEYSDIGWKYNKQVYVVVITLGCLRHLQGDKIHGNT